MVAVAVAWAAAACGSVSAPAPGAARPGQGAGSGRSVRPSRAGAVIAVARDAPMTPVPRSFLGVSTEYSSLPVYAERLPLLERVLAMLHVPGGGPLILRIGGDSADRSFWSIDPDSGFPSWAYSVTPHWLDEVRALVRRLGVRLIIDLNLVTDSPDTAARWAQAAVDGLPRGSIDDFEIGNEPDIYSRSHWALMTDGHLFEGRALPAVLGAATYRSDFLAYARALRRVAPAVALAGPALANPATHVGWIRTLLAGDNDAVSLITIHRYPYSACARPGSPAYPTIARVLSARAVVGLGRSLGPAVALAHSAGLPIRLTELNSVTCGGRPGVSDTFATALWAPAALFELVRAGVDGANIHVRDDTVNEAFAIGAAGLSARPLLYGLALFTRALGPGARMVALHLTAPAAPSFRAWAVRAGDDLLHVLVDNEGRRPVIASLHIPGTGPATLARLRAPTVTARSGVTLAGQSIGADARWQGRRVLATVAPGPRGYRVDVPALSAALLSVRVPRGALGVRSARGHRRARASASTR